MMQVIICYTWIGIKNEMANKNKDARDREYPLIVQRQHGEYCMMCKIEPWMLVEQGRSPTLCIDHINNNDSDNRLDNYQLLCKSCNTKKNHPTLEEPFARSATPEMIRGKKYESDFRRWVAGHYMENENIGLHYDYLINTGAEIVECSTETIKRYLNKMTSSAGIYEWFDKMGSTVMVLKSEYKN